MYIENRFQEEDWVRPKLDGVRFKAIGQQQKSRMSEPFNETEIKVVVWECGSDETPGPDGVNFEFVKEFWEFIKSDVLRFMDELFVHEKFPKGCNASFLRSAIRKT